jgi:hypothetical protein
MKSASPVMLDVLLTIRSASREPLANGGILDALGRLGLTVRRADHTREGMTILCKGDVKTLRICAEHSRRCPS